MSGRVTAGQGSSVSSVEAVNQTQPFIVGCRNDYRILSMFCSKIDGSLAISGLALCNGRVLLACLSRGWSSFWFAKTASGECCADQRELG